MGKSPKKTAKQPVNFATEMVGILTELKRWAKQIIHLHRKDLEKLQQDLGIDCTKLSSEDDRRLMREILDLRNNAQELDEFNKWTVVYSAAASILALEEVKLKDSRDAESLVSIYLLGCARGAVADLGHLPTKLFEDHFHREKSKQAIRRRWEARDNALKEPLQYADGLWEKGEAVLHDEMAAYLEKLDRFKQQLRHVGHKAILKALVPIAKKYNRVRGMKGMTKKLIIPSVQHPPL